ncbi:MAG TPA: hypothetical protein VHC67_12145 [Gaiellaceae bacterium]|nr:hypothetical protein [Gaiellaceae bacterium]
MNEAAPERRPALDRLLGAYPLLVAYLFLLILYAWQTTKHTTPWLFTDELQWANLSRGVAHHGVPEIRLQHQGFSSLYEYLIAPAWWARTTADGYAWAKYIGTAVMTASLFPAYALARLFVPRWPAIACGVATAAVPALYFGALLIPEPLAYFWSTLALWLIARALLRQTWRAAAAAAVVTVLAPAVRSELTVLILAGALAAVIVYATGPRGRALIAGWSPGERLGAAVLIAGLLIAAGAFLNHHSYSWQVGGHYHHRMFTYGLWAIGAFTIGLGILPVAIALAWLLGNGFRTLEERSLGAVLIGAFVAFALYTAIKASYISTNFAIRVEERNLIYLSPLVFAAVARWLTTGRTKVWAAAVALAAVGYLIDSTPYHNYEHFYSDAPGLSVLQWLNQHDYWTTSDARHLLFGILAGTAVVFALREVLVRGGGARRFAAPAGAILAALVVGWNLWGEIAAANASNSFSHTFVALPQPPSWIDNETGKAPAMFIGQSLGASNQFWSLEFWNQSLQWIWSVDATAPGPGRTITPNYLDTSGAIDPQIPVDWVVAAPGVDPVGRLVETAGGLRLFRVSHPIRLRDAYGQVTTDANWMSTSAWYYHFAPDGPRKGTATVTLSRAAACGDANAKASTITVKLSSLKIAVPRSNGQPIPEKLLAVRHVLVRSTPCDTKTVTFHVSTPFRIDLSANRTFQPSQYDPRQLSAQVGFDFKPD